MKIAFTICSNNYLAQAKILGDTLLKYNSDYKFIIGLVDSISDDIDYDSEIGHEILCVESIKIPDFDSLWKKYDIVEFNTCVKPFYFEYLIKSYSNIEYLFYFDPDIAIYNCFLEIEKSFKFKDRILLTPHIFNPIELDNKTPNENNFLNFGIYNLGFLGLKEPESSIGLIRWWGERTYKQGFNKPCVGLFVDQLWFNLVPVFFENVRISHDLGMNMGPWNLHERSLIKLSDRYMVNSINKLSFYHFSSYRYTNKECIAKNYDRYDFINREDLIDLYSDYHRKLIHANVEKLSKIECVFMLKGIEYRNELESKKKKAISVIKKTKKIIKLFIPPILVKISIFLTKKSS